MSPSAIKTIIFASAVVLLVSLSGSVDTRNESAAVTHHHKHHEKAKKCKDCKFTINLNHFASFCYHEFPSHTNAFVGKLEPSGSGKVKYVEYAECGCCNNSFTFKNGKAENWHLIYEKDVTWCYNQSSFKSAKEWYDNFNKVCD